MQNPVLQLKKVLGLTTCFFELQIRGYVHGCSGTPFRKEWIIAS